MGEPCEKCSVCGFTDGRICLCACHPTFTEQVKIIKQSLISQVVAWQNRAEKAESKLDVAEKVIIQARNKFDEMDAAMTHAPHLAQELFKLGMKILRNGHSENCRIFRLGPLL